MKRDNTTIGLRIKKLGLTSKHVAMRCKMNKVTLSRTMTGHPQHRSKETIEKIHKYLDSVKT